MGGKKFETAQPESYLFGDNSDLNYLGPKPHNVTYQLPDSQPVRALKCLVNIRKDSLRLVRVPNPPDKLESDRVITNTDVEQVGDPLFNVEFTFDADSPCYITIYYNASEKMCGRAVKFTSASSSEQSDTVHYSAGCNQQFCVPAHAIDPSVLHREESKPWNPNNIPIAIQVCAECGPDFAGHSHITYATFDKTSDGSWTIKATKQKQAINGVCYLFQEIYGIENKAKSKKEDPGDAGIPNEEADDDDDDDDDNSECVVCLSDTKDTLILPCKHLCLCSGCANQLRFQQSGCPICRQPFRALLQIRAVRKKSPLSSAPEPQTIPETPQTTLAAAGTEESNEEESPLDVAIPPGYEPIPLINAINGPVTSASFASLTSDGGSTRTGTLRSCASSTASSVRRSKRKKKAKATIDVENEIVTVETDGNYGNEKWRSRSRRKKKAADDGDQINAEQAILDAMPISDGHLHVSVDLTTTPSTHDVMEDKGDGDHVHGDLLITNADTVDDNAITVSSVVIENADCKSASTLAPETVPPQKEIEDILRYDCGDTPDTKTEERV